MARTLRRKNYIQANNTTWDRQGCKTNGYYTEYDFADRTSWLKVFRVCTKQEQFKKFKIAHLDGGGDYNGAMDVTARRLEMKTDRQKVRGEISRFMKGVVEDVIVSEQKKYPFWYW